MEELNNEKTMIDGVETAGADEKESEQVEKVSLGKFKDVNSLLSAYNSLQSEFTKRCQKLKELEVKLSSSEKINPLGENAYKNGAANTVDTTPIDKDEIVREYLKDLLVNKQTAILLDGTGVGVKTPINRPKTISEASNLARELFTK